MTYFLTVQLVIIKTRNKNLFYLHRAFITAVGNVRVRLGSVNFLFTFSVFWLAEIILIWGPIHLGYLSSGDISSRESLRMHCTLTISSFSIHRSNHLLPQSTKATKQNHNHKKSICFVNVCRFPEKNEKLMFSTNPE